MNQPAGLMALTLAAGLQAAEAPYDVLIRNGRVYDGGGGPPQSADLALRGDRIAAMGRLSGAGAKVVVDAGGMAVCPGFINMLSWANESLIQDGLSQGDIRQGVTLEVLGEGESMGPLNPAMKAGMAAAQGDIKYTVDWTTLAEYLDHLVRRGVACNVASFVGAATLRVHELRYADRPPTPEELGRMQKLASEAMEQGAMGVSSALIYAPGFYAKTDELIALAKVSARYGGLYISHLRSEGNGLLPALEEFLRIAGEAGVRAEIYHLKAAGQANWGKLAEVIRRVEAARGRGLQVTADMYTYTAGATGLDAAMPPWVQEGGYAAWAERLRDPGVRERVRREMRTPTDQWESLYLAAGSPGKVLLAGFKNPKLKPLTGKTLAEVAEARGVSAEDAAMDLVIEDGSRVSAVYFMMSEENVRRQIALPWVSFCSDEGSYAPVDPFLRTNPHPRAYGNVARLLGRYVREEKIIPLEEAVRRLTSLPAEALRAERRGRLKEGFYADVVVLDPATVADHATYEAPHQFASGVRHVFVNGVQVLRDGESTGATPGRVVRGPGWKGPK